MDSRIATIARHTWLEALRTRLAPLVVALLLALLAASFFLQSLAVIEAARFQAGFYAAATRLALVFVIGLYVLVSVTREFDDKGFDVLLALDLPRSHYVIGRLSGFVGIAMLMALLGALPLAALASPAAAAQWMISLALELAIVAALALFCVLTFSQLTVAAIFVLGFYVLARSITAIRLISAHPLGADDSFAQQTVHFVVESLALVVPAFDEWTRTAWLVDGPGPWSAVAPLVGEGLLYVTLLAAAAMFDLYRKNF